MKEDYTCGDCLLYEGYGYCCGGEDAGSVAYDYEEPCESFILSAPSPITKE